MNPFLAAAIEYASLGWHVFPVEPRGKRPLTSTGHLEATNDINKLAEWWSQWPEANIGISLEPSGLVVLDVDVAHGKKGLESLAVIDSELPSTLLAVTGSGGFHAFYKRPPESAPARVIGFRDGLDLLSKGYVVAAPSVHASGNTYAWRDITKVAPLPTVLRQGKSSNGLNGTSVFHHGDSAPILEGGRNSALLSLAGGMRRAGMVPESILAALQIENLARCSPPLSDEEVKRVVTSAVAYRPSADVAAIANFKTWIDGDSFIPATAYGADVPEFLGMEEDPTDDQDAWLIQGLLPAGVPVAIAGPPKSRKTFLMHYLAICIAAGKHALGREAKKSRVLVIAREDTVRETRRRIWRIARGLGFDPRELAGWLRIDATNPLYLDRQEDVERLHTTLSVYKPGVVFIDCLSRVHLSDENDRSAMAVVTNVWGDLTIKFGCTVALLHHYRKGEGNSPGQRMRGSSDLFALVRVVIGVEGVRGESASVVELEGNLPGMTEPFRVDFLDTEKEGKKAIEFFAKDLSLEQKEKNDEVKMQIRVDVLEALSQRSSYNSKNAVVRAVGRNRDRVLNVLDDLVKEGIVQIDASGSVFLKKLPGQLTPVTSAL